MIDVIIPAYNCSKTLDRTLGSLIAQTDSDFKVTIVDDCSTEDIKSIIDCYTTKLNISYIRNEHNLGCGMSRQVGIDNTSCDYFCFLDSDDVFMPYAVETFNATIKAKPNLELLHTYFYEKTIVDGVPALLLKKDGFTWCHGKIYNRKLVEKYGIKNDPEVKWADDSFFNSMCSELMKMDVVEIPTMVWVNNYDSVSRKVNKYRDKNIVKDFLVGLRKSVELVLQYKDEIDHLEHTIDVLMNQFVLNEEEQVMLNDIMKLTKKEN